MEHRFQTDLTLQAWTREVKARRKIKPRVLLIASAATAPVQEIIPLFEDAVLFKQPPPKPPCPICTLPLMATIPASKYQLCCGKTICCGCFYAVYKRTLKKQQAISKRTGRKIRTPLCPCCREPQPNIVLEDGKLKMGQALKKLLGDDPLGDPGTCNDATALVGAGEYYSGGIFGFTKNQDMAIKFWHRASYRGLFYNNRFMHLEGGCVGVVRS